MPRGLVGRGEGLEGPVSFEGREFLWRSSIQWQRTNGPVAEQISGEADGLMGTFRDVGLHPFRERCQRRDVFDDRYAA